MILNSKSAVLLWAQTNMAASGYLQAHSTVNKGTAMKNVTDPLEINGLALRLGLH